MSSTETHRRATSVWVWLAIVLTGNAAMKIEEIVFDLFVYGAVSRNWNHFLGMPGAPLATFVTMVPISVVICLSLIKLYDLSGQDWLGFEAVKEIRDSAEGKGPIKGFFRRVLQGSDLGAFFLLSCWGSPFQTTAYLRKKEDAYHRLTARDWRIFLASVLVSNGFWTMVWILGWNVPSLGEFLFGLLPHSWQTWLEGVWQIVAETVQPHLAEAWRVVEPVLGPVVERISSAWHVVESWFAAAAQFLVTHWPF